MQETRVRSLEWENPLEKEMATHSRILVPGNPMDRGAWWATVHEVTEELGMTSTKQQQQTTSLTTEPGR